MRRKKEPEKHPPCGYNCGNPSEGYVSFFFHEWTEKGITTHDRGFSIAMPSCRNCLRESITLKVTIPKVAI